MRLTNRLGYSRIKSKRGDAGEFEVSLVDQYGGMRRGFHDFADAVQIDSGSGGIIRIRDQNGPRLGANIRDQFFEREGKIGRTLIELADRRAGEFRIKAIHRIRRTQQQNVVAVIDVSVDQHLNRFVGPVREQKLIGRSRQKTPRVRASLRRILDRRAAPPP